MTKKQKKEEDNGLDKQHELKKIIGKIVKLTKKKDKKIAQMAQRKKSSCVQIANKVRTEQIQIDEIVEGRTITDEDLPSNVQKYISDEERGKQQELKNKKFKINEYWLTVFKNSSYAQTLTQADLFVLEKVNGLRIIQYSMKQISLEIKISNHPFIRSGSYQRAIIYDEDSKPTKMVGNKVVGTNKLKKGIFKLLFCNIGEEENSKTLAVIHEFMVLVCEEIIPFSLEYYLRENSQFSELQPESDSQKRNLEATSLHDN